MELFLSAPMLVAIFVVDTVIIVFIVFAVVSGLFQVVYDRLRKRVAALRTKAVRTAEEPVPRRVT